MRETTIPGLVPPELARIRTLSKTWQQSQGLRTVPVGVWILMTPYRGPLKIVLYPALVFGFIAVDRYYAKTFGHLVDEGRAARRLGLGVLVVFALLAVVAVQIRSTDGSARPDTDWLIGPVAMALAMLASWWWSTREHADMLVAAGLLGCWGVVVALRPEISASLARLVTSVFVGLFLIAHGIRAHVSLMRDVRSRQQADVGAV